MYPFLCVICFSLVEGFPFITQWELHNDLVITLPLTDVGIYDFNVEWGDETSDVISIYNQNEVSHTYSVAGNYTVNITGTLTGWRFDNAGDRLKLVEISQWGDVNLGNQNGYFFGCENLTVTATDVLNLTGVTNLRSMFHNAYSLTTVPEIELWDLSAVSDLNFMFHDCHNFNSSGLAAWDVKKYSQ